MRRLFLFVLLAQGCVDDVSSDLQYAERLATTGAFDVSATEKALGDTMLQDILSHYSSGGAEVVGQAPEGGVTLVKHEPLAALLQRTLHRLPEGNLHAVVVLDTTDVLHFALPNGYLVVSLGLLMRTRNEHEIAGVLAHELSAAKRGLLMEEVKLVPKAEQARRGVEILLRRGFDRSVELRLDIDAWQAMQMGGFEPSEYLRLLERWALQQSDDYLPLQATHPEIKDRVDALARWSAPRPKGPKDIPESPELLKMWQEILR